MATPTTTPAARTSDPTACRSRILGTMVHKLIAVYDGWIAAGVSHDEALRLTLDASTAGPAAVAVFRASVGGVA